MPPDKTVLEPVAGAPAANQGHPSHVGAYRVLSLLGHGGMGSVYLARHQSEPVAERQGGDVALKVMHPHRTHDEEFRKRFEREARLGLNLSHPGIVGAFDLVVDGGTLAIAMEYAPGRTLADLLAERGGAPFPVDWSLAMFRHLLDAAAYAHGQGVVHRDIKPDNIVIGDDGSPKILDFGIAKESDSTDTRTGAGMGTVVYMAPEQYVDAKTADARADVYALGMTLYEVLAGRLPWPAQTTDFAAMNLKARGELESLAAVNPGIPAELSRVVDDAIAAEADDRIPSVAALSEALQGATKTAEQAQVEAMQARVRQQAEQELADARRQIERQLAEAGQQAQAMLDGARQEAAAMAPAEARPRGGGGGWRWVLLPLLALAALSLVGNVGLLGWVVMGNGGTEAESESEAETEAEAETETESEADPVVARYQGKTLRLSDVDREARTSIVKAQVTIDQARHKALDSMIFDDLVGREARAAGMDSEVWLEREVDDKIAPVTDAEARAFFAENPPRGNASFSSMKDRVVTYMERERLAERRNEVAETLEVRHGVVVTLEPLRIDVSPDDDPHKGPAEAPVTIIEFADFQCGFCARSRETTQEVLEAYPQRVRFVYRDFPIEKHPRASQMAQAANCAREQNRYWGMYDLLFDNIRDTEDSDLKGHARSLGLDMTAFETCYNSGRHAEEVAKDVADGKAAGVSGTPAFFINGRMISGAQPFEAFEAIIDDELERAGISR